MKYNEQDKKRLKDLKEAITYFHSYILPKNPDYNFYYNKCLEWKKEVSIIKAKYKAKEA